jgi:hypothetical protein
VLKKICLIFALLAVVISCKKEVLVPNDGIYRGVFNEIRNSGDTVASGVVYLALWDSNLSFQISGDTVTNAPAPHAGTYLVDDATRMHFSSSSALQGGYDTDHYLDTTYNYTFDDTKFEFWFQDDTTLYQYRLTRN